MSAPYRQPEPLSLLPPAAPPQLGLGQARLTLFLALFPPEQDAARIAERAEALARRLGLEGRRQAADRLHVTLHVLGHFRGAAPPTVVEAAKAGASTIVCAPLPLLFDRALRFVGSRVFVLRCNAASDAEIARLRLMLALALRRVGLRATPSRTPHMTLLYDAPRIEEHPIEPIAWTANEFALVLSHVGQTRHDHVAHWPLDHDR